MLREIPKVTKVAGGERELKTPKMSLYNFQVATLLFDNPDNNEKNVRVLAVRADGTEFAVPFHWEKADAPGLTFAASDGVKLTEPGAYLFVVYGRQLAHYELSDIVFDITSSADRIGTAYILQTQPRYAGER